MSKDLFSGHADLYASFRPTYPNDLFQFIFKNVGQFDKAWDCGTGNGQVAQSLAPHFKSVEATDISRKQLENAKVIENINYQVCSAESTPFSKNSFDLISVGQAIHWFDLNKFYSEVCLLKQPWIKDPKVSIEDLIKQYISKFGENITVGRFARYEVS